MTSFALSHIPTTINILFKTHFEFKIITFYFKNEYRISFDYLFYMFKTQGFVLTQQELNLKMLLFENGKNFMSWHSFFIAS